MTDLIAKLKEKLKLDTVYIVDYAKKNVLMKSLDKFAKIELKGWAWQARQQLRFIEGAMFREKELQPTIETLLAVIERQDQALQSLSDYQYSILDKNGQAVKYHCKEAQAETRALLEGLLK